jgi:hypothetical protein
MKSIPEGRKSKQANEKKKNSILSQVHFGFSYYW